jgi:hypothetical protein
MSDEEIKPKRLRKSSAEVPYTEDLGNEICEYIAQGMTLREACRQPGMPPESTVRLWVLDDRYGFAAQYARARNLLIDYWSDEIVEIADDSADDTIEVRGRLVTNHEVVNRSRLRIDTRKWLLSKLKPERYGEQIKVDQTSTFKTVTDEPLTREERQARWMSQFGNAKPGE